MSSLLYGLGRWAFRTRKLVLALWVTVLVVLGASAGILMQPMSSSVTIPGTESQAALDTLSHNCPQVSGASAQIVVVAPEGEQVDQPDIEGPVADAVDDLADIDGVSAASDPLADDAVSGGLSESGEAAIISVQLDMASSEVTPELRETIDAVGDDLAAALPEGSSVAVGGQAFLIQSGFSFSITEIIGLVIALVVLMAMFGSFVVAGLPLLTAIIGVMVTIMGILLATAFSDVSSTAPALALMLGLAVGIDYALFVISRHVAQLRAGMDSEESVARAVATAGSAVIFAGLTVMIALVGLSVVNIPFLTVMGVAAAVGVGIAVIISLTLTPALLGFASRRIERSIVKQQAKQDAKRAAAAGKSGRAVAAGPRENKFFAGWVRTVTRIPALTIVLVIAALGAMALPALDLRLALPDAGSEPAASQARQTYDVVAEEFGAGYNGPLIVTGSIVESDDPLGLMADLKDELLKLDNVADVPLATPNLDASTGIIQVVPGSAPESDETKALVQDIRDLEPYILDKYGVAISVTGFTAVGIDVSDLLSKSLLPFIALIVGLSLVLLTMVFRSIWVPIKATIGFLLTVGASFGAVSAVFSYGWLGPLLHVEETGPVISFMPIILIGVLFGLAMDYEVFLVSRMREEYVHGGDARDAIRKGFLGSSQVVTAAAIIMFAVFAAFVPEGEGPIKQIALGLAVGVFVDAFIVRMTLVPAVLQLLGDKAWWMPRWLDRILPSFDVEGEGLSKELALADWANDGSVIAAEALRLEVHGATVYEGVDLCVAQGEVLVIHGQHRSGKSGLAYTIAGRVESSGGRLKVTGLVMPQRSASVRGRVGAISMNTETDPVGAVRRALAERPRILVIDDLDDITDPGLQLDLRALLASAPDVTLVVTCVDLDSAELVLPRERRVQRFTTHTTDNSAAALEVETAR